MPYIPDEIGLHIMLYCSKYDIVKLMCALGYSTLHMDEVFATINKYRPPVITTLNWRGMVVTAHDDYIVDVYFTKDYLPHSDHSHCDRSYFSRYKLSAPYEDNIVRDILHLRYKLSVPYTDDIVRDKYNYNLRRDNTPLNIAMEGNTNIFYPQDVYFTDNGSHYQLSYEERGYRECLVECADEDEGEYVDEYLAADEDGVIVKPHAPSIYEYHDMLFGLALLAKRGYWMKSTYKQCYKGGDYDHWFWSYEVDFDHDSYSKVHFHAIGNKIVDFEVYSYGNKVAVKHSTCSQENFRSWSMDTYYEWIKKYDFGLRSVLTERCKLELPYYELMKHLEWMEKLGYYI